MQRDGFGDIAPFISNVDKKVDIDKRFRDVKMAKEKRVAKFKSKLASLHLPGDFRMGF